MKLAKKLLRKPFYLSPLIITKNPSFSKAELKRLKQYGEKYALGLLVQRLRNTPRAPGVRLRVLLAQHVDCLPLRPSVVRGKVGRD